MKHDRLPQVREGSILTRKRFQFASALLIGAGFIGLEVAATAARNAASPTRGWPRVCTE